MKKLICLCCGETLRDYKTSFTDEDHAKRIAFYHLNNEISPCENAIEATKYIKPYAIHDYSNDEILRIKQQEWLSGANL